MTVRSIKIKTIELTRAEDDPGADILTEEVLVEGGRDKRWGIDSSVVRMSVAYIPALAQYQAHSERMSVCIHYPVTSSV